jgi:hypothetical protein
MLAQRSNLAQHHVISYAYGFFWKFLGAGFAPGIAVDVLQRFPANCLYRGRNRLQVAV